MNGKEADDGWMEGNKIRMRNFDSFWIAGKLKSKSSKTKQVREINSAILYCLDPTLLVSS